MTIKSLINEEVLLSSKSGNASHKRAAQERTVYVNVRIISFGLSSFATYNTF
jgi:hypothetical protein